MASRGEETDDDTEIFMEPNTLIEKNGHLELYKGKKRKPIEVANFLIEVVGEFRNKERNGYVIKVKIDDTTSDTWHVAITTKSIKKVDTFRELIDRKERIYIDTDNVKKLLTGYVYGKIKDYIRTRNKIEWIVIDETGCHRLENGSIWHAMPGIDNREIFINEMGTIVEDINVLLTCSSDGLEECLRNEAKLMHKLLPRLLDCTPEENRAQVALFIGWLISALNNVADCFELNPLCNIFGPASCGKSTTAKLGFEMVGCAKLIQLFSNVKLLQHTQRTTLPACLDDPNPHEDELKKLHDKFSCIAHKLARTVGNNPKDTSCKGSATMISNFNFKTMDPKLWAKIHGLLSRSVNLQWFEIVNKSKEFNKVKPQLKKILSDQTCYAEIVAFRYLYSAGERKEIGEQMQKEAETRLEQIFVDCADRALDCYKPTVFYTFKLLHYLERLEIMELVYDYLERHATIFHRLANASDVLAELSNAFRQHWELVEAATSIENALSRTIVWDEKFRTQYLYVAYHQLKLVFPDLVKLMKQATNNLCWTAWKTKHHFPAGVQANCFKIPRSNVPIALIELIAEFEDKKQPETDNTVDSVFGDTNNFDDSSNGGDSPNASGDSSNASKSLQTPSSQFANLDIETPRKQQTPLATSTPNKKKSHFSLTAAATRPRRNMAASASAVEEQKMQTRQKPQRKVASVTDADSRKKPKP